MEGFFYDVVIFIFSQPYTDRYGEAQFFLFCNHIGQVAVSRLTHCIFCVFFCYLIFCRYFSCYVKYHSVQEGYTYFQRVSHGHFIRFQQDIADEPEVDIDVLHFCDIIQMFYFIIERFCQLGMMEFTCGVFQDAFSFLFIQHERVTDESFLQVFTAADEVVFTFHFRQFLCHGTQTFSDGAGQACDRQQVVGFTIDVVAAEEFVCTFTGHGCFYMLCRCSCNEVQGNRRRVSQRLVHVILYIADGIPVLFFGDQVAVVIDFDFFRQCLCIVDFIIVLIIETNSECFVTVEACCNVGTVNAAGEEGTNFNIGDLVGLNGILHCCIDLIHPLVQIFAVIGFKYGFPVAFDVQFAVFECKAVSRHQFENAFEECFFQNAVLECQIVFQSNGVYFFFHTGVFQNGFDFGTVNECAVYQCVVEGFDTEEVTGTEKSFILFVPDNEGKHTAQFLQDFFAPFFVAVDENFSVSTAAHHMAFCDQFFSDFLMVVDFAIECNDHIFCFVIDRLMTALQIQKTQSAETHGDTVIDMGAAAVGTTVDDLIFHFFQNFFGRSDLPCKAAKAAHNLFPP